jgi:histidyl-tRNA synthetase
MNLCISHGPAWTWYFPSIAEKTVQRSRGLRVFAQQRVATRSTVSENKEKLDLKPPKGTRDFFPADMRIRRWLFSEFEAVSRLFGFEPYDSPVLENEALFVRKAGEEIRDQLFNFVDKGDRAVALRPELTPSLARMVLARAGTLPLPLKWYGIGQCWRYERMTRGRRREHYQWNMDIVGVEGVEAEAELLGAITMLFSRVGLTAQDVKIKVNNRKVLQALMEHYAVPLEKFSEVCVVLDKQEKLPRDEVQSLLTDLGVSATACAGILDVMASKKLSEVQGILGESHSAVLEVKYLFELAEGYQAADWLEYDASVVRGLAYYTGTVFEAFDQRGSLRAICGGGRYDKLLGTFGGDDLPMVGFGFGDAVIMELLQEKGKLPELKSEVQDVVLCMDASLQSVACAAATRLRSVGRSVDLVLQVKKLKWAFKHAERLGAERLVLVGQTEWEKKCVRVKTLAEYADEDVLLADLK